MDMELSRLSVVEWNIALLALIMVIGGAMSIALTTNPDWMSLHLSRLGEGGNVSSYLFNATAAFSGLAMYGLSMRIMQAKGWQGLSKVTAHTTKRILHAAFRTIAVCLVGLSIFPYDKFIVVHNTFGYGMTVVFLAAVAIITYKLPVFSNAFKLVTGYFLLAMLSLFAFYFVFNGRQITLLQVQILGLVFFFVWLIKLARAIR